jgi:hypothetical protein
VLVVVGLSGRDGESSPGSGAGQGQTAKHGGAAQHGQSKPGVSVSLEATAEVWVCMLDGAGRELVDGQVLEGGTTEGPFRSDSFTVSFGNGEVSMEIDGKEIEIPPSASPIGYSIASSGSLEPLSEGERPTCL